MVSVKLKTPMCIIIETLKRIGVANPNTKTIHPTAYIIDRGDGSYFVSHFKELFSLVRGSSNVLRDVEVATVYSIARCLEMWGLVEIDKSVTDIKTSPLSYVILKKKLFTDEKWRVEHKFNMLEFKQWKDKNEN